MMKLEDYTATECACAVCQSMCRSCPCWGTPREIVKLIRAGHGYKLMLDWWIEDDQLPYTEVICPAEVGLEAFKTSSWRDGACTFFVEGRCSIHAIKPSEGRFAIHVGLGQSLLHLAVARTWNNPSGRRVVRYWKHHFPKWQQKFR